MFPSQFSPQWIYGYSCTWAQDVWLNIENLRSYQKLVGFIQISHSITYIFQLKQPKGVYRLEFTFSRQCRWILHTCLQVKAFTKENMLQNKYNYTYIYHTVQQTSPTLLQPLYLRFYYFFVFAIKNKLFYLFFFCFFKVTGDP